VKLAELERYFAAVATSTSGPPADLAEVFKNSAHLPASALLAIYNRGYHYRLLQTLASVFVHTQRALGQAEFERLGLRYLAQHPSEHPAVERVGRLFPEYLGGLGSISPELIDIARLEWARLLALVAPEPPQVLRANAIDVATFPSARLGFVSSLSVLSLEARALARLLGSTKSETADLSASIAGAPVHVAVWRKRHRAQHEALSELEFEALTLAQTGASVSAVCTLFDSGSEADDATRAFQIVSLWFTREWVEKMEQK
jgi:hypothetical protein